MSWLDALPNGFRQVFTFIVIVLCCVLFLCILAWMLHWGAKYFTFLPWPK